MPTTDKKVLPNENKSVKFYERALAIADRKYLDVEKPRWTMIDADKFETLLDILIGLNDRLNIFLSHSAVKRIRQKQIRRAMNILMTMDRPSELRRLAQALRTPSIIKTENLPRQPPLSSQLRGPENDIANLAAFKADKEEILKERWEHQAPRIQRSEVSLDEETKNFLRPPGEYNGQRVWLE